jgi:hypothetical protein
MRSSCLLQPFTRGGLRRGPSLSARRNRSLTAGCVAQEGPCQGVSSLLIRAGPLMQIETSHLTISSRTSLSPVTKSPLVRLAQPSLIPSCTHYLTNRPSPSHPVSPAYHPPPVDQRRKVAPRQAVLDARARDAAICRRDRPRRRRGSCGLARGRARRQAGMKRGRVYRSDVSCICSFADGRAGLVQSSGCSGISRPG